MTTGIILAVIFLLNCMTAIMTKRVIKHVGMRKICYRIHMITGIGMLILAVIHVGLTFPLRHQRPAMMYVTGILMITASACALTAWVCRKKIGKMWSGFHKFPSVIILLCLLIHIFFGISSLTEYRKAVENISIHSIDVSDLSDGIYYGECNVGYIYARVCVNISNGSIQNVSLMEHRKERGQRAEVIPQRITEKQKTKVDAVSGATNSSKVIMKAVENALSEEIEKE